MKNEPVAWMFVLDGCRCVTLDEDAADQVRYNGTPLYTHPSEHDLGIAEAIGFEKGYKASHPAELTDEDLEVITEALLMVGFTDAFINYELKEKALAILRKASEK